MRRGSGLALAIAAAAVATGCCRILDDLPGPGRTWGEPSPTGPATELGTAVYPPGTPTNGAAIQTWIASRLRPSTYRVGYGLSPAESGAVGEAFRDYASSVDFEEEGGGRFRWSPPRGCAGDMHCVFESLAKRAAPDLAPLVERFRARQRAANLTSLDLATLVVTYVQSIRYEIPRDQPFGILPPPLVVSQKRGDCDSKSLLAHLLLRSLGIDSLILSSNAHKHAMLGIALPVPGAKLSYGGRQYARTEMTAKGSPIGHVNPELLRPDDWRPVPFRVDAAPASEKPKPAIGVGVPRKTGPAPAPGPRKKR